MLRTLPALCAKPGPICALGFSLLSWQGYEDAGPPAELVQLAKEIVNLYKQAHGGEQFFAQLPHDVQGAIQMLG
jgi:hypothetical protein